MDEFQSQTFQQFLYSAYGDSAVSAEHSRAFMVIPELYYNYQANFTLNLDLRNSRGHKVASMAPYIGLQQLQILLTSDTASESLAILPTPRLATFTFQAVISQQPNLQLVVMFQRQEIYRKVLEINDSWQETYKANVQAGRVLALQQAVLYSSRYLPNGKGEYKLQLQETGLCGLCLKNNKQMIFASNASDCVIVRCDGFRVTIQSPEGEKVIEGVEEQDCYLCIRLRPNKYAQLM